MNISQRHVRILLLALATSACGTLSKDPSAARDRRPSSVGLFGAMHHPSSSWAVGTSLEEPKKGKYTLNTDAQRTSLNDEADNPHLRQIHRRNFGLNSFLINFPWKKSFLFYGINATITRGHFAYSEKVEGFALNENKANVEWIENQAYVGVPVGLSLTYDEGITLLGGIGPKWRVYNRREVLDDGTAGNVDIAMRDKTLAAFDNDEAGVSFQIMGLIGYSF